MIVLTEKKKMKNLKIKLQGKGEVGPLSWNFLQINWIEIPWGAKTCNEIQILLLSFEGWSCWVGFCISCCSQSVHFTRCHCSTIMTTSFTLWLSGSLEGTEDETKFWEHWTLHRTLQVYHKFHSIYPLTESDPHTNECNSPLLLIFSQMNLKRLEVVSSDNNLTGQKRPMGERRYDCYKYEIKLSPISFSGDIGERSKPARRHALHPVLAKSSARGSLHLHMKATLAMSGEANNIKLFLLLRLNRDFCQVLPEGDDGARLEVGLRLRRSTPNSTSTPTLKRPWAAGTRTTRTSAACAASGRHDHRHHSSSSLVGQNSRDGPKAVQFIKCENAKKKHQSSTVWNFHWTF